jgi:hypothetical protein
MFGGVSWKLSRWRAARGERAQQARAAYGDCSPSLAGLILVFAYPVIPVLIPNLNRLPADTFIAIVVVWQTLDVVLLAATVRCHERAGWSSIGIGRLGLADPAAVIGATLVWLRLHGFLVLLFARRANSAAGILTAHAAASTIRAGLPGAAPYPTAAYTLFLLTGAIMEEVGSRAYLIERLRARGLWFAAAASLGASLILHLPAWGIDAFWRIPNLVVLVILYVCRPSLAACSITHFIIDILIDYPGAVPARVLLWRLRLEGLHPGFASHPR